VELEKKKKSVQSCQVIQKQCLINNLALFEKFVGKLH